jgi:hypothetical protein
MALGRVGVGVALVFALAGTASAQPYTSIGFGGAPPAGPSPAAPAHMPVAPSAGIPVPMPSAPNSAYATVAAMAEDHAPLKELPSGLPDLVPPPEHGGHGAHGGHGCATCGEHDEIPGSMTPFFPGHSGWYATGEFLLMRPRSTDFDYVIPGAGAATSLSTIGPVRSLQYGVGTGFRTEVGRNFGEGGLWDAGFAFTYFNGNESNDTNTAVAPAGGFLFPTLTRPGLTDRALTATANADLDYALYDMIVGRRILVDDNFAVRFIGGGRFADIRQTFNAFYDGADARRAAVNTRSHFQGFGPIIGAEAILVGWKGFHLYTRAMGGLITGRSSNRLIETNDAGATTYVNTNYDVRKVVPMGSIAIGGGWQYRTLSIRAGYQVTCWQGLFQRPRFVDDVSQGKIIAQSSNLTLDGLFLQVGLTF